MIQQTSLDSYWQLDDNTLGQRQAQVLEAIAIIEPANNRQIAEKANLPINVVTPRVVELRELGKIVEAFKATDEATNRRTIYWRLSRPSQPWR